MTEETNENKEKKLDIMHQTIADCKMLYCEAGFPASKTCMCWLWECNKGWYNELHTMSYRLEALNLRYYDKYKVRVQLDQVKEKWGFLCVYHSVVCDNYTQEGLKYKELIDDFESKKDNDYFGIKHVVDKKGYTSEETDENGNTVSVWHQPETHIEITKNKEEYEALSEQSKEWHEILLKNGRYELTIDQRVIIEALDAEAEQIIDETIEKCHNICEDCGCLIGDYLPRCQTTGWVSYICHNCAEEPDRNGRFRQYFKNGALYEGKKLLKTKEQVDAENAAREAEWEKEDEVVDNEDEN